MRNLVLWVVLLLTLAVVNVQIARKEMVLRDGQTVLLELLPVDPRSLLQGDYMALRYSLSRELGLQRSDQMSVTGRVVVWLDDDGVAHFVRHDDESALAAGEQLLKYRKRGERARIASEAFFFEEGQEPVYRDARYGELRVDDEGNAVLVGLRDADFNRLGPGL